jgi:hypothetical protein
MIFDPVVIDTNQVASTNNNNTSLIQMHHQQQQQQQNQISSALMQQILPPNHQIPSNANMFYGALQSAAFLNYHLQQQQQQSKLNRLQQIQQQQLIMSQNAQNPYFMDIIARNNDLYNLTSNKPTDQLLKVQKLVQNRSTNPTTNKIENQETNNEKTSVILKENIEFSPLKFYKEVELSLNSKQEIRENLKLNEDSQKLKRPMLKFGMDSILGNNSSSSNTSSVQSTPSASPCKKICLGM